MVYSHYSYSYVFKKALQGAKYYSVKSVLDELYVSMPRSEIEAFCHMMPNQVFVPIPMYAQKEKTRGFNQAHIIAMLLSTETRIPVDTSILVKKMPTEPQAHLSKTKRIKNLQDAFACRRPKSKPVHCILVDDVYTTGSTIQSAINVLQNYGYDSFSVITLARSE